LKIGWAGPDRIRPGGCECIQSAAELVYCCIGAAAAAETVAVAAVSTKKELATLADVEGRGWKWVLDACWTAGQTQYVPNSPLKIKLNKTSLIEPYKPNLTKPNLNPSKKITKQSLIRKNATNPKLTEPHENKTSRNQTSRNQTSRNQTSRKQTSRNQTSRNQTSRT